MSGERVELYRDRAGDWRFTRIAGNGKIVATGESYARRVDAYETAAKTFPGLPIVVRKHEAA